MHKCQHIQTHLENISGIENDSINTAQLLEEHQANTNCQGL